MFVDSYPVLDLLVQYLKCNIQSFNNSIYKDTVANVWFHSNGQVSFKCCCQLLHHFQFYLLQKRKWQGHLADGRSFDF